MAPPIFKANIQTTDPELELELIQRVGSGTYGEVYKSNVKATGQLAAVKIINIEPGDDFDIIQQEIKIMQECKHANIVQYFGSYLRKNKLWIAMEYCGGGSLQDIYNVTGPLTELMISFACAEMLKGLDYMHNEKKMHRDIKAANILLTTDGDVKLADFGVGAQISSTIGKRSTFIGTPYWMAPEVAAVDRTGGYDYLCDIWAVGIVAIELADCQPPLFDLHPMRALYHISKSSYKPPTVKDKTIWSKVMIDFIKQSLTKNPKKRPRADRLLQHPFCTQKQASRVQLRELLDKYEQLKLKKKKRLLEEYASDEEKENKDKNEGNKNEEEKESTVKRIKSKKYNKKKGEERKKEVKKEAAKPKKQFFAAGVVVSDSAKKPEINEGDLDVDDEWDVVSTIKAAPQRELPPPPSLPLPPPPPPSMSVSDADQKVGVNDIQNKLPPPPLPPRGNEPVIDPEDVPTLTRANVIDPPPLPPRASSPRNSRPVSQLFTQKATKNCFQRIFNECPLKLDGAASWNHPETKANYLLFASDKGIYSMNIEDAQNIEMFQVFSRPCKWLYVVKNVLISISGESSFVYMHNLMALHGRRDTVDISKGGHITTKVPGTANTQKCCVAHNPYNNEMYLYCGRKASVLLLQWYEPLKKFMIVKDFPYILPTQLPIFEPIIVKGEEYPAICVGAYDLPNGDILIDKLHLETGASWEPKKDHKAIELKSFSQLEPNLVMLAYGKQVLFVDINGSPVAGPNINTKLNFDYDVNYSVCLPGSVLIFSEHAVQGKSLNDNQITAHFFDNSRTFKLLCSDRIVAIEARDVVEQHSNLYILASN